MHEARLAQATHATVRGVGARNSFASSCIQGRKHVAA
jgi:hypothetical protein